MRRDEEVVEAQASGSFRLPLSAHRVRVRIRSFASTVTRSEVREFVLISERIAKLRIPPACLLKPLPRRVRSSGLLLLQHRVVVVLSSRARLLLILSGSCAVLASILHLLVEQTERAETVSHSLGAVASAREIEGVGAEL